MIYSVSTVERSAFATFHSSLTSSYSSARPGASAYGSYTSAVSWEGGKSTTILQEQDWGTLEEDDTVMNFHISSSATHAGGTTYYGDATQTSASSSDSYSTYFSQSYAGADTSDNSSSTNTAATGFSFLTGGPLTAILGSNYETDFTYNRNTSSYIPVTSSHWIVSGSGVLTTESKVYTLVSVSTDEGNSSSWAGSTYSTAIDTYFDSVYGYTADTDWLWQISAEAFPAALIEDVAASADVVTQGPNYVTVPVSYVTAGDSAELTGTQSIPADTTELDYQILFSSDTTETSWIIGDTVSFGTSSSTVGVWETTSASMLVGNDSTTAYSIGLYTYSFPTVQVSTQDVTATYSVGFNTSTTELTTLISYLTTTSYFNNSPAYLASSSSSSSDTDDSAEGHTEMGQTIESSDVSLAGFNYFGLAGGYQQAISPIAPAYALVAPSNLRSDGNPYSFCTNYSYTTTVPYGNFASVVSNAGVPMPTGFTTTGTNSHTFSYKWSKDTLQYTEASTSLSGTFTVTERTKGSGIFSPVGDVDSYYQDGGATYGGFPAIPTATESVQFAPRAVAGTSIATNGASTTYRTVFNDSAYSELAETLVVENAIPAFAVFSLVSPEPAGDLLIYVRNP